MNYLLPIACKPYCYLYVGIFAICFNINLFAAPEIQFKNVSEELIFDWGRITPDMEILSTKIPILNNGTDTLLIKHVKPGCGCTTANLENYKIPPKDSTILHLTLNTRGFKGHISKSIDIETNIEEMGNIYLFLQAYVVYPIAISPKEFLIFQNSEKGVEQTQFIELINTTDSSIVMEESRPSDSSITYDLQNNTTIPAGGKTTVHIKYIPSDNQLFRGAITLKFNHPKYEFARIFITGIPKKEEKSK